MNNSINNISFKATLTPTFILKKNEKRLNKIMDIFSKKTEQFANDKHKLYMSNIEDNAQEKKLALHLDITDLESNPQNVFFTNSLDKYLETKTNNQIAQILNNIFIVLHNKDILINKLPRTEEVYNNLIAVVKEQKPGATTKKTKALIINLEATINSLQNQYNKTITIAKDSIKKAIRGNDELKEFAKNIL